MSWKLFYSVLCFMFLVVAASCSATDVEEGGQYTIEGGFNGVQVHFDAVLSHYGSETLHQLGVSNDLDLSKKGFGSGDCLAQFIQGGGAPPNVEGTAAGYRCSWATMVFLARQNEDDMGTLVAGRVHGATAEDQYDDWKAAIDVHNSGNKCLGVHGQTGWLTFGYDWRVYNRNHGACVVGSDPLSAEERSLVDLLTFPIDGHL